MRIAIQGGIGSFHTQAAEQWFGNDIDIVPADTFKDVFNALRQDKAETAVVAIENSLYGSINEVLDLIETYRYPIIGEVYLRIKQQLITLPDAKLDQIKKVYSQDVALAQCEEYLSRYLPHAQRIEYFDTAASVKYIRELNDSSNAAIAGDIAAKAYNLPILAQNIEDDKNNFTRFLILTKEETTPIPFDKASIVLTTDNTPGSLARVLTIFAEAGANLTKLQSRPIIGQPWRFRFYIDLEIKEEQLKETIKLIKENNANITILGVYMAAASSPL